MMGNRELFWSESRGIGLNLELIWANSWYFTFLRWHQCSSRLVRDFWGTLCTSVKQTTAPYLFDWEQGIALHAMQVNQASSFSEREVWLFFRVAAEAGVCSQITAGVDIKNFCLFIDVRTPVMLRCTPQESKLRLAGQYGRTCRWSRRPRFTF